MLLRNLFPVLLLISCSLTGQAQSFTRQDTLRGSITPERAWWDLNFYHLSLAVNPEDKTIKGSNLIRYKVLQPAQIMQIDLQPPLKLEKAVQNGRELAVKTEGNAHFRISLWQPRLAQERKLGPRVCSE